ncbi:tryptophan 7-halogenase [Streptomyces sp. KR80]|uniref:tryptophan 7-halogenase n=1 Tax=Streptomyces sp. KR80 TaxID=3457426 RepID=UPI003FD12F0F
MTRGFKKRHALPCQDKLRELSEGLPASDARALAALLPQRPRTGARSRWRPPFPDPERARTAGPDHRPRDDDPQAIRRIGVIGGGTAGYLTALALRAARPWLDVTVVESSRIPIIGVGEATTPPFTTFLHHYINIDPVDFHAQVRPTWKLGINFDWGPYEDGFMAPFDWAENSIGVLGSLAAEGHPDAFTLQSLFMRSRRVPVFRDGDGQHTSLMDAMPFAYHLENRAFVRYLTGLARERGIGHLDAEIGRVELSGPEWVEALHTKDGGRLEFDLYIDCTGFRSLLLGQALGTKYLSYSDSLFVDSALTGFGPQSEAMEPYTAAHTMDAGWCWSIPVPEEDHLGYVYSSAHLPDDKAAEEMAKRFPEVDLSGSRTIRFRVGRYEEMWRGNVIAIGNSYGFVEPLESSALLMISMTLMSLIPMLPASWSGPGPHAVMNGMTAQRWDGLRWFLALHYKFNQRRDTAFWRDAWSTTDVSGIQPLLDVFEDGAPLHLRDPNTRRAVGTVSPTFYDLAGVDCLLLGQQYPCRLLTSAEPLAGWQARRTAADALVRRGLTQRQALEAFTTDPELMDSLVYGPNSWVTRFADLGCVTS